MRMIETISIEVLTPAPSPNVMRLGTGVLDTAVLGDRDTATAWVPITAEARSIDIRRGSQRAELGLSAAVGTLTVTLLDAPDTGIRPNTPVRVLGGYDATPLFTGRITDIFDNWQRLDDSYDLTRVTTITAVDAVHELAQTGRYGVVLSHEHPWDGFEFYPDRVHRYLAQTGLPYETGRRTERSYWNFRHGLSIGGNATSGGDWSVTADDDGPAILRTRLTPGFDFTRRPVGYGEGVMVSREPWAAGTTIHGGIWIRITPGTNGPPPQTVAAFLHTDAASSQTPHPVPVTPGQWQYIEGTATVNYPSEPTEDYMSAGVAFVLTEHIEATGPLAGATRIELCGAAVSDRPFAGTTPLQSVVYESTIASHMDVAAASVGSAWWVDRNGIIQAPAVLPAETYWADLADDTTTDASPVRVAHSFDTAGLVNAVILDNHGRTLDPETGDPQADDVELGPWTDVTSQATYGNRSAKVETMIHLADASAAPLDSAPAILARHYLDHASRDAPIPSSVRIHNDTRHAFRPELMDLIHMRFRGENYTLRVISIEHNITPRNWHTTYDLIER